MLKRREVRWERMFPDELEAAFEACPVAYLPYGLCEPHGPQNAVGMDALRAHAALCQTAEAFGGIVAPPEYWHCHEVGLYATWANRQIGEARPWLTAVPPWVYLKNICYHIRAVDALGFKACILFSGHSGPHHKDVPVIIEIMHSHVATRLYSLMGVGTTRSRFDDDKGMGGHAGRGETTLLWASDPDCVDLSRLPEPDAPGPHFAMGAHVDSSNRLAGEQMVGDIVQHLSKKAGEMIREYDSAEGPRTPVSFADLEDIWEKEIAPGFSDLASMQIGSDPPPRDSQWYLNYEIPDRS